MRYLLDTNILIALLHPQRRQQVLQHLLALPPDDVVTSAIAAHELYFGAAKSSRPEENRRRFDLLFQDLQPLEFTREDAATAGTIRAELRAVGTPIGPYDVLMAGQAKARDLTLVTHNTREFTRIHGLAVVDWLAG
ncbi:MAG: type II toxin-antitoxin system VapC family toxin [Geminicoccaceae bacterium]